MKPIHCSGSSLEAWVWNVSLTLVQKYSLCPTSPLFNLWKSIDSQLQVLPQSKKGSFQVPHALPNVLISLPGPGHCSLGSPPTSLSPQVGIFCYWLSQKTNKETVTSQGCFRTPNLALCYKFPTLSLKFSLLPCIPRWKGSKSNRENWVDKSFLIGNSFEDWNFSSIKTEATESKHRKKLVPFCCHGHLCLTQHCPQSSTMSTQSFSTVLRQKADGASSPCPPQVKPEA